MNFIGTYDNLKALGLLVVALVLIAISIALLASVMRNDPGRIANKIIGVLLALIPMGIALSIGVGVLAPEIVNFLLPGLGGGGAPVPTPARTP